MSLGWCGLLLSSRRKGPRRCIHIEKICITFQGKRVVRRLGRCLVLVWVSRGSSKLLSRVGSAAGHGQGRATSLGDSWRIPYGILVLMLHRLFGANLRVTNIHPIAGTSSWVSARIIRKMNRLEGIAEPAVLFRSDELASRTIRLSGIGRVFGRRRRWDLEGERRRPNRGFRRLSCCSRRTQGGHDIGISVATALFLGASLLLLLFLRRRITLRRR